jgi:flagellar FliL protein
MSTAAAAAPAPKGGKKKLIIIVAIALLLAIAGAAAVVIMKKKAAAAEEDGDEAATEHVEHKKHDPKAVPAFAPLDPFTVNLADHDAERYAQISLTLELEDAHMADEIKAYMPAIRNNILMVLSHKTAVELLEREGKTKLAREIQREASRALGVEIEDEEEPEDDTPKKAEDDHGKKKKKKKKKAEALPIKGVFFANFIIQ